ncbi:MAG: M14 family zinc carboxypeptidase [Bacteroidota bacterium]
MRYLLISLVFISTQLLGQFRSNYTPTYQEAIEFYERIQADHPSVAKLETIGKTDSGKPLHYLVIDPTGEFSPEAAMKNDQTVVLIMNGIHPGEACGINASISFALQKAADPRGDVVYVIIPIYNVGGALNRNSHTRANQNGPEEYGFRGNARNLDLNRDFIKADSENAFAFSQLFHLWNPHIFIDTHTTNGADYQPNITLISPFSERLIPMQATFLKREFEPYLYNFMKIANDEMIPYVNFRGSTPEDGIFAFLDYPRYSSGYVSLFNTIGFIVEAHMLKPFDVRVTSTLNFIRAIDKFVNERGLMVRKMKFIADKETVAQESFYTKWQVGKEIDSLDFPGYETSLSKSILSGGEFVEYDNTRPYRRNVPYYNEVIGFYKSVLPKYYVIPQAWSEVIDRLEVNNVAFKKIESDTIIEVISKYAIYYETADSPYEGHYIHSNTGISERKEEIQFFAGDILISTEQKAKRYLANTLDPQSKDSFFNWNFFDSVLNQKEYFSSYLFEKTAAEILERDHMLRNALENKKKNEPSFANDARAQLRFVYENSVYYEKGHLRIPVFEIR